eukprot:SAG31_NODE_8274_length_1482_cov_1.261027_2_plen_213_part_00
MFTFQPEAEGAINTQVLEFNPRNAKALFRRSQAYAQLGQTELAAVDAAAAAKLRPGDKAIAANSASLSAVDATSRASTANGDSEVGSTSADAEPADEGLEQDSPLQQHEEQRQRQHEQNDVSAPESGRASAQNQGPSQLVMAEAVQAAKPSPPTSTAVGGSASSGGGGGPRLRAATRAAAEELLELSGGDFSAAVEALLVVHRRQASVGPRS